MSLLIQQGNLANTSLGASAKSVLIASFATRANMWMRIPYFCFGRLAFLAESQCMSMPPYRKLLGCFGNMFKRDSWLRGTSCRARRCGFGHQRSIQYQ
jgi:hypothetical protein